VEVRSAQRESGSLCFVLARWLIHLRIDEDDIVEFAKRLRNAGVDVNLNVAQSMPHNAPVFADYHADAKKAFNALVQFIQAHLD
jgi:acetyl esterase/lipase